MMTMKEKGSKSAKMLYRLTVSLQLHSWCPLFGLCSRRYGARSSHCVHVQNSNQLKVPMSRRCHLRTSPMTGRPSNDPIVFFLRHFLCFCQKRFSNAIGAAN